VVNDAKQAEIINSNPLAATTEANNTEKEVPRQNFKATQNLKGEYEHMMLPYCKFGAGLYGYPP
jgi:hypothetical protein